MEGDDKPADTYRLILELMGSSEDQVYFYQTSRRHKQEDGKYDRQNKGYF
jgi:hypothetical protein